MPKTRLFCLVRRMDSPANARTGRRLLQAGLLLVLCGFVATWWFGLHQPWLRNREYFEALEVSVETTNVLPPTLAKIFGSSHPYFERVEVIRGGPNTDQRAIRHLHHLHWVDLRPYEDAMEPGAFSFVDCPKLERIYLVGATSLQIIDCPALQEVHLVRCLIGPEAVPTGVRVFVDGRPAATSNQ